MDTIICGLDGSASSNAALDFAVREAALRGGRLRILSAWDLPPLTEPGEIYPAEVIDCLQRDAQAIVDDAISRAQELKPGLPAKGEAIEGHAGYLLIAEAQKFLDRGEGDVLVVVGRRGHRDPTDLLLGSVSQQVVHHAPCPVTVVQSAATQMMKPETSERSAS